MRTASLSRGGDGTINEAVNGVCDTHTVLGLVPVGTGNILAHQLHMPILSAVTIKEVGDALLRSRVQCVDVGVTNGRRFLCWAGLGLDAEITAQMEPRPKGMKHFRTLPYIITGVTVASEYRGVRTRFVIEDRTFRTRTLFAVATNIQLYASFFNIAPHARMDDGLLDIFVFRGVGFAYTLRALVQSLRGRHLNDPHVMHALASKMEVETATPVAVHLDGDPFGSTPASFSLQPLSLRLLIPPNAPESLFTRPPEDL